MDTNPLFTAALGLISPWTVIRSDFQPDERRLELQVDFKTGSTFSCPDCAAAGCGVHDTEEKRWRHLDFFQHQAFIVARVPRVRCGKCGVRLVTVPWARRGSGFTLLMEGFIVTYARSMPIRPLAQAMGVSSNRLWRVLQHIGGQKCRKLIAPPCLPTLFPCLLRGPFSV